MGIIQGFYQIRAYKDTDYTLYYEGSGTPVMKKATLSWYNYSNWMVWQPVDSSTSQISLISTTKGNYDGKSFYSMISSSNVKNMSFNTYQCSLNSTTPNIIATALSQTNEGKTQQWIMTKTGTATYDGVTCDVVTFKHCLTSKYLDCTKAMADTTASPTLEDGTNDYQKWVLSPMQPYDPDLAAPTNFFLQSSTTSTSGKTLDWWTKYSPWYWQWTDTTNTINAGYSHKYRERSDEVKSDGSTTTGTWSAWTAQTSSNWVTVGNKRWMTNATTVTAPGTNGKCRKKLIQMQTVRPLTVLGATIDFHSTTGSGTISFADAPTLTKDGMSWTPEGLLVNFTSSYFGKGSMTLTIGKIRDSSGANVTNKSFKATVVQDTTITIPTEYFTRPLVKDETLTLQIWIDTDIYAPNNRSTILTDTAAYHDGNVDITPTVTELDGLRWKVNVPWGYNVKAWLNIDGVNTPLTGTVEDTHTIFEVIPPFGGKKYAVFVCMESSDKTKWGTAYVELPAVNIRAHAFTWDGGSVFIWLNKDEALQEGYTFTPQATTHTLAGRSHDVVTYLSNAEGDKNYTSVTGDIKGYIVPQIETYGTTRDSIEKLVEQGHVLYRSPYGRVCNVAVTGADINTDIGITEVSVSIVQEDD